MSSSNPMTVPWAHEARPGAPTMPPAMPPTSETPTPAVLASPAEIRDTADIEGDADEIEKYFASLMQRVGGASKPISTVVAPAAASSRVIESPSGKPKVPEKSVRSSGSATSLSPAKMTSVQVSAQVTAPAPKELPPPRAEKKLDLQVLRDVASVHRQGAIDRHDLQSLFRRAYGLWFTGLTMCALTLGLSLMPQMSGLQFTASLAAFAGAIVCTISYCRLAQRHRRQVDALFGQVSVPALANPPASNAPPSPQESSRD